jgi:hypothetical protein
MPGGYIYIYVGARAALQARGEDGVRSGGRTDGGHVSARTGRCAPRHVCQPTPRHEGEKGLVGSHGHDKRGSLQSEYYTAAHTWMRINPTASLVQVRGRLRQWTQSRVGWYRTAFAC